MLRQAGIYFGGQAALTWVSGHRTFVATGEPIFACKDAPHNRDDGELRHLVSSSS
jgi:hypothetical protein